MSGTVFRSGINVGSTSQYTLPFNVGSSGQTIILGPSGQTYWGTAGITSIPTLSQVLSAGNTAGTNWITINDGYGLQSSETVYSNSISHEIRFGSPNGILRLLSNNVTTGVESYIDLDGGLGNLSLSSDNVIDIISGNVSSNYNSSTKTILNIAQDASYYSSIQNDISGHNLYTGDDFFTSTKWSRILIQNGSGSYAPYIGLTTNEGAYSTDIYINKSDVLVTGSTSIFGGLKYQYDYSSNFTSRSLVDRAYVDSKSSGMTGSGSSGYVTYWNGSTSITGNSNFTYDSSTNVLKLGGSTGGFFVDVSGDPSPVTFPSNKFTAAFFNSEGKTSIYDPNRMAGSAEGSPIDAGNLILGSSTSSTPGEGYNGPGIVFSVSDDANNGSSSAVIQLVVGEGSGLANEDGSLLVFGTRPHNGIGGPYDPKEGFRIGRNQWSGVYYKPGPTQSPPTMLTVGTYIGDKNTIGIRETSATPSTIMDYGQIYVKSSDKKVYFMDSSGVSYDLTTGGTSSSSTPSLSQVLTVGATASSNIDMSNYSLHKVTTIKSANNIAEIQTINMINASLLNLMYNT